MLFILRSSKDYNREIVETVYKNNKEIQSAS